MRPFKFAVAVVFVFLALAGIAQVGGSSGSVSISLTDLSSSSMFAAGDGGVANNFGVGNNLGVLNNVDAGSVKTARADIANLNVAGIDAGAIVAATVNASGAADVAGALTAGRVTATASTVAVNGIYLPSANVLGFSTNSTARMNLSDLGLRMTTTISLGDGTVTVADNGGGTAASVTLTTGSNLVRNYVPIVCNDTDGCSVVMSETLAAAGQVVILTNTSANSVTLVDSAGVLRVAGGSITLTQHDSVQLIYEPNAAEWKQFTAVLAL